MPDRPPAKASWWVQAWSLVDRHLIDRLGNLRRVLGFVVTWTGLVGLVGLVLVWQLQGLLPYYSVVSARPGGVYTKGLVGPLTNLNPLYATTTVDQTGSQLIFSGLLKYDQANQLVPDLASSYEVGDDGTSWLVTLKDNLWWHDGQPLTAGDVVFTIKTIQDPLAQSALYNHWQGVVIRELDSRRLQFELPFSFSAFPHLLTVGILPQHLLAAEEPATIRTLDFNYNPVGSGPFRFEALVTGNIPNGQPGELKLQLERYDNHHGPLARLAGLTIWAVPNQSRLTDLFNQGQLSGAAGLVETDLSLTPNAYQRTNFNLMAGVYLFYKQTSGPLADQDLRQAVSQALDLSRILAVLERPVTGLSGPLLPEHLGYDPGLRPPGFDPDQARATLEASGWHLVNGQWQPASGTIRPLAITAPEDSIYADLAAAICQALTGFGLACRLDLRPAPGFFQETVYNHTYQDMLVYGLDLGVDPDVYSFWHSTQIDVRSVFRLNLAEYQSAAADRALEVARSRHDPDIRREHYRDFQSLWQAGAVSLGLYRPQLQYYSLKNVTGPQGGPLTRQADLVRDVAKWTVLSQRQRLP